MPRTFEFLKIPDRTVKPRTSGMTAVADTGLPNSFVEGALELWSEAIDVVKISSFTLTADDKAIRRKIEIYNRWGVSTQAGGPALELARLQNLEKETIARIRDMGFDALEISAEALPTQYSREQEEGIANLAKQYGLKMHGEVGKKFPEGDRMRRSATEIDLEALAEETRMYMEFGCEFVYLEGHLLRQIIGDNAEYAAGRGHQIVELAEEVGQDNIVFEVPFTYLPYASKRILQHWLVTQFGPNVNVGNVILGEIQDLEVIRCGMFPVFGAEGGDHPYLRASSVEGGTDGIEWWKVR